MAGRGKRSRSKFAQTFPRAVSAVCGVVVIVVALVIAFFGPRPEAAIESPAGVETAADVVTASDVEQPAEPAVRPLDPTLADDLREALIASGQLRMTAGAGASASSREAAAPGEGSAAGFELLDDDAGRADAAAANVAVELAGEQVASFRPAEN